MEGDEWQGRSKVEPLPFSLKRFFHLSGFRFVHERARKLGSKKQNKTRPNKTKIVNKNPNERSVSSISRLNESVINAIELFCWRWKCFVLKIRVHYCASFSLLSLVAMALASFYLFIIFYFSINLPFMNSPIPCRRFFFTHSMSRVIGI